MSVSSYSENSSIPAPINKSDYDPHSLPPYLSTLELQNLCEPSEDFTELEELCIPHPKLYHHLTHFQSLDWTIQHLEWLLQKEHEEIHKVFSVLKIKGVSEALAPANGSNNTNHTKSINNDNNPPLLSLFLTLLLFHLLSLQDPWLHLWNPQFLLQSSSPLTTLLHHFSLHWNLAKSVAKVEGKLGIYWNSANTTITGTPFWNNILPFLMIKSKKGTIPPWTLTFIQNYRRLGSLWLRKGVMLHFSFLLFIPLNCRQYMTLLHGSLLSSSLLFLFLLSLLHTKLLSCFSFPLCFTKHMDYTQCPCFYCMFSFPQYLNK